MLGISIYPNKDNVEEILEYLNTSSKYGVKRIFTNLLEADEEKDVIVDRFRSVNTRAHELGMEVIIDVSAKLFGDLDIDYEDLSFFNDMAVDGVRIDEGFDGSIEAEMTRNKYGLKIEINASVDSPYVDQILYHRPRMENLITCHNFYPQKYTGLGLDYYLEVSEKLKARNLKVATFITSQSENAYGVWKDSEREPTLEYQRELDLQTQYKHLLAFGVTDDIIISNCYATEDELRSLREIDNSKIQFTVIPRSDMTRIEENILFRYEHFVRPDMSEYVIRSTKPRLDYSSTTIPYNESPEILKRGDVVILNDNYGRYKGELHIVMNDVQNDKKRNLVGRIVDEDMVLLDFLCPNKSFEFLS